MIASRRSRCTPAGSCNARWSWVAALLLTVTSFSEAAAAQTVAWTARKNGTAVDGDAQPGSGSVIAGKRALAVDGSGKVYVTGTASNGSNNDFLTVAYDATGSVLWSRLRNGAGNGADGAYALAVGGSGTIYVTGYSHNGSNNDFLTVAYDSAGNELWAKVKNGAANGNDSASALAVDGAENVYVTGGSHNGANSDYLTVAYDSAGNELWTAIKNGAANLDDGVYALAATPSGTVFVTGYSYNASNPDYLTVAYDNAGGELWARVKNGAGNGADSAQALAADATGNVFVTGYSFSGSTNDFLTVAYDSTGNELWARSKNLAWENAFAVALDGGGRVLVTGISSNGATHDYLTVAYDSAGNEQWAKLKNGAANKDDFPYAMVVDGSNNVFVTGYSNNGTNNDYLTVAYDSAGTELWAEVRNGVANGTDTAYAIGLRPAGGVYVAGYSSNGANNDYLTVAYDSAGTELWAAKEPPQVGYDDRPGAGDPIRGKRALAVDGSGNVYVTGQSLNGTNYDYLTVAYDSAGTELWAKVKNGAANNNDQAYALAVDGSGNVYVTGVSSNGVNTDYLTVAYDSAGTELWAKVKNGAANSADQPYALAVDGSGNVYVTGQSINGSNWDYLTVAYDSAGTELWAKVKNGAADNNDQAYALGVDGSGNVYVTGYSRNGANYDYLTVAYDSAGTELWAKVKNGAANSQDYAYALAVDGSGNVYVTGSSRNGANDDFLTVVYDSAGNELWAKVKNGMANNGDYAYALAADGSGNVYVTGQSSNGVSNGYLTVAYDSAGTELWAKVKNGTALTTDQAYALAVDGSGNVYVTGQSLFGSWDYLTVAYDSAGTELWQYVYDGGGEDASYIAAVAGDGLYVSGHSAGQQSDFFTIKFSLAADTTAPTVFLVEAQGSQISETQTIFGQVVQELVVRFDEEMNPTTVQSGSAFRLVSAGADRFESWMWGSPGDACQNMIYGDDQLVPINFVQYVADPPGSYALLNVALPSQLPDDRYLLVSCPALQDEAGNALQTGSFGDPSARTFTMEFAPPRVLQLGSNQDTGDGELADGESTNVAITSLTVFFDQEMLQPNVSQPGFYLLIEANGDGFQTAGCQFGVDPQDQTIPVNGASYYPGAFLTEVALNNGAPLPPGSYRLFLCTEIRDWNNLLLDGNGDMNPGDEFVRSFTILGSDSTPPTDPAFGTTAPTASTWSADNTVEVTWSGAADEGGGSGLAGYSIEWNTTPVSTPDTAVDLAHTADPHATTSAPLSDGDSHYFHLSTCDNAGNCTSTVHAGPFWIDATPPSAPGAISSASHGDGLPHVEATIDISWGAATDALSGLGDYRFAFDSAPAGDCGGGGATAGTGASSASLAEGIWYAHVCATDLAGNESLVHGGPYIVGADLAYASSLVSHQAGSTAVTGNGASTGRYVSADGRYVAFSSLANDLIAGGTDSNGVQDAFLWDRVANTVSLISHLPGLPGTAATGEATATGISSDGAFVAFHSTAPDMIAGGSDTNGVMDAFLWERASGTVTLISHQAGLPTTAGDEISYTANGAISANGQRVPIYSNATNLVAGGADVSGTTDALLWDRSTGFLTYISHRPGTPAVAVSSYSIPTLVSADGEFVAFYSQAVDLISGGSDTNGNYDVYLWERATGSVVLASHVAGSAGVAGNGLSSPRGISGDGGVLIYLSYSTDIVPGFSNNNGTFVDSFAYVRSTGESELISRTTAGPAAGGNSASYADAVSPDGRYVLFTSASTDLVPGVTDPNGTGFDLFLRDRVAGTTELLTAAAGTPAVTSNNESVGGLMSNDGRFALYKSLATDLVAGTIDSNGGAAWDVYLHDRVLGVTELLSHAGSSPTATGNGESLPMALTPAGDRALIQTSATDLVAGVVDPNGTATDLYVTSGGLPDSTPPIDPAIDSTSPVALTWSADNTVEVTWSGAADEGGGSGLAGYSIEWNTTPVSTPDTSVDITHTGDPHSTTSPSLGDGSEHYFHLSTCDSAGNCTSTEHAGPFWIDTTAPSPPGAVASSSHAVGIPSASSSIDIDWGAASDAGSGVASYRYAFDANPTGSCLPGTSTTSLSGMSGALGDGTWYAHVCAQDDAGNQGPAVDGGPYLIDGHSPDPAGAVYFSNFLAGDIRRVGVDGTGETVLVSGENVPLSVAVDGLHGKVYWGTPDAIRRANLDGSGVETVATMGFGGYGIAIDAVGGRLFWIDLSLGAIRVAALDGSGAASLHTPSGLSTGLDLDRATGKLYWTDSLGLRRSNLDGTVVETVYAGGSGCVGVDSPGAHIFFSPGAELRRVGTDGTGEALILDGLSTAREIDFDAAAQHLFWVEEGPRLLRRAHADGSGAVTLATASYGVALLMPNSDWTPPSDPGIDSTSPVALAWSTDNTVEVTWSGAADEASGSGLAGYSIEWNTTPVSAPDTVVDLAQTADPHSTTSPPLGDGSDHYFHLSTCDNSGNCTSTVHAGPFWIDTTAPTAPAALTSSSHGLVPSSDATIDLAWTAASDAGSGVAGYSLEIDGSPTSSCETTPDFDETILAATSLALPDGTWYAHVCAVDEMGSWGAVADGGPYVIDSSAPGAETELFFSVYSTSSVYRVGSNGAGLATIFNLTHAIGVDWEPEEAKLYAAEYLAKRIHRANRDGSSFEEVLTDGDGSPTGYLYGVAVDKVHGKIYWTDRALLAIRRANLDGTSQETVVAGSFDPTAIEIDAGAGWLFFCDYLGHKVYRARFDGSELSVIYSSLGSYPLGLALNRRTQQVFIGSLGAGTILRAEYDGTGLVTITNAPNVSELAFDPFSNHLFWQTYGGGIWRSLADGSAPVELVTPVGGDAQGLTVASPFAPGPYAPTIVAAQPPHVEGGWSNQPAITLEWSGAAIAPGGAPIAGYSVTFDTLPVGYPDTTVDVAQATDPQSWAHTISGESQWYFHLRVCDTDGDCAPPIHAGPFGYDSNPPVAPGAVVSSSHGSGIPSADPTIDYSWGAAVDGYPGLAGYAVEIDGSPSWLCDQAMDVGESVLSGTTAALADGTYYVHVCAVDLAGNWSPVSEGGPFVVDSAAPNPADRLFFSEYSTGDIETMQVDGSSSANVATALSGPGLALDPVAQKLYFWIGAGWIQRSNLDGTGIENVVLPAELVAYSIAVDHALDLLVWVEPLGTKRIVRSTLAGADVQALVDTDIQNVGGLAIDAAAGHVYWTDMILGTIQRVKLDGSDRTLVFTALPGAVPYGLTLDSEGQRIFWTDAGNHSVHRVSYAGTGDVTLAATGYNPAGIVFDPVSDHLYFVHDYSGLGVERMHADGTGRVTLSASYSSIHSIALLADLPPTVVRIRTTADTGDGRLDDGESTGAAIVAFEVLFSEPVADPPGSSGANDVTNPANYLLVEADGDGFQTGDCATGVAVGDSAITIDSVSYESSTQTADLAVNGSVALPAGSYRLLVCGATSIEDMSGAELDGNRDGQGGDDFARTFAVVVVDSTPPTDPAVGSTSPVASNWSTDNTVAVSWSGATDELGGSGLAGYSIAWDTTPVSTPDTVVDAVHTADPHSTTSLPLADGSGHYFHLSTCDNSGNCTATVHAGPFWIDTTAPSAPGAVNSGSHAIGVPTADSTIDLGWGPASDALSGILRYEYAFDGNPSGACTGGSASPGPSTSSDPLADGTWYVHVCALDNAGNRGAVTDGGPYVIDTTPPASPTVVFFANAGSGEIRRINFDGTGLTVLVSGESSPLAVDVDPVSGKLFWGTSGAVRRSNLDGSGAQTIATTMVGGVYGLAVDSVGGRVYWMEAPAGTSIIRVANLDGSASSVLFGSIPSGNGLAVDSAAGKLYWTENHNTPSSRLRRSNLDGSGVETVFAVGSGIDQIDVDSPGGRVFYTSTFGFRVRRVTTAGTGDTILLTTGAYPREVAYDAASQQIFWVEEGTQSLRRANADGTGVTTLTMATYGLALYDADADIVPPSDPSLGAALPPAGAWSTDNTVSLSWSGAADEVDGSGLAGYSIEWNHSPLTTPDPIVDVAHSSDPHSTTSPPLADAGDWYFHLRTCDNDGNCTSTVHAGPFQIDTAPPGQPGAISSSSHVVGVPSSVSVLQFAWGASTDALSGLDGYAYAVSLSATPACDQGKDVEESTTSVGSGPLADGSWYVHVCAVDTAGSWSAIRTAGPFVVDAAAPAGDGRLYVTDWGLGQVLRYQDDGTSRTTLASGLATPHEITVDAVNGKLYWGESGSATIKRSNLDGTGVEVVVTGATGIFGVAVDATVGRIYWTEYSTGRLRRSNLDGTGVSDILTGLGGPNGLALDRAAGKLYWANNASNSVQRVNTDGTDSQVIATATSACDVDLDLEAGKIYWSSNTTLQRSNLDGTSLEAVLSFGVWVCGIAVDTETDHVYWVEDPKLRRARVDGTEIVTLDGTLSHAVSVVAYHPVSPIVSRVSSIADTGDGQLADNELTSAPITALAVTFDHAVSDPAGDSDADDVTNPANYLLVEADGDGFQTSGCSAGADPGDIQIAVDSVSYDSATRTATASVHGGVPLPGGSYRLFVCGSTSITDLDGLKLDGDGDGTGGDDFMRSFEIDDTPPTTPSLSADQPVSTWSSDSSIGFSWTAATDDNGIAGYSSAFDHSPATEPDAVTETSGLVLGETASPDAADWWFHVRACDTAGNCGDTAHLGPFQVDTTAPGAAGAASSSSHDSGPASDTTIDVAWGAASDGLSGVASYSFAFDGNPTGSCLGGSTASLSATSGALADGSHYVHVCAVDLAGNAGAAVHGGPYVVDTAGPTGLVVSSSSHTVSTWSNDSSVDFAFSGAADANGVTGYAIGFDQAAATVPACSTTQAGTTFTGSSSSDGSDWWIHVRARDSAGNCGATVHHGPFWIDTTAPGAPGAVISSSHDGGPTNDPTIDVAWGAATDALSGIDGYSFLFNGVDQDCDFTIDSDFDERAASSPPLAAGSSYFHVCAVDLAGNWGAVSTGGPYVIDLSAPHVTTIDSVASSGGAIGDGEVVNVEITQLLVSFDEAMDATLAQSLGNYLLVFGGNDGTLDTTVCGPLQGDDQSLSIDGATYSGQTSTLTVNGATALADGTYRLLVCASLEDAAGNPLDGDGDGTGGDDFSRSFRVDLARPTVTLVQTLADTGDGSLGENEATNVAITELRVSFSEEVLGGDSTASFLLVEAGFDGTLDTAACGPLAGDDASVNLDSAVYSSLTSTSTLTWAGGAALADGVYRLLVCGTITDLGGNVLDDDDDGDGNVDFARRFVVDTVPPTNPTAISSSTHPYAAWSQATAFTVEWDGATDELSGLAGYSVVIDGNPSGSADSSIEVGDVAGTGTLSTTLGEGYWYVHVRACDNAGNCAPGVAEDGFWGIDTSAPSAPGAISSPSHDPAGTAVSDATIDVAWGAATDAFAGVASYSYAFDGNPMGSCPGGSTASLSATSGALADGSWYLHVCAVDHAGNIGTPVHSEAWIIDRLPPESLAVNSPSHSLSTWSNDSSIDFVFSGATDANGVAGYAIGFDQAAATVPACSTTQAASTFTASSSADGNDWWIHVRARDTAGNCGDTVHLGPFWIDTAAPGAPGAVLSSSHDGGPTNDPTIDVAWGAATDALSGIDGYSFFFNGADDDCDGTMDSDDDERSAISPPLAAGTWYFHVCAVDLAGNWGAVTTGGAYTIDLSAPHVTTIDSVATSGGAIGEAEVVNVEITQLLVSFDEAMDATLAESVGNYLLLFGGNDGTLDTTVCGPLQGDDQSVSIDGATYAGQTSTLAVNGAASLTDGTYRLLVCSSLADVAGNPLDGDGNGSGGDDFSRSFRVDLTPPTVTLVNTVVDTGDGVLTELEPTNVGITELLVAFDEEVLGGDSSASFLLVEGGLDGTLDTTVCGPLAGDDTSLAIDSAVYSSLSLTSALALNGGAALPDGEYRLLACATLTDLGGNALDGDDDGDGHDDFARTFTVDTVPPTNPTALSSSTHILGAWSSLAGFAAEWSGGADDRSGLAGYSVGIDGNPATPVDCTIEVADAAGTGSTAATLGEGAWYVHVRLVDRAGNCAVGETEAGFWGIDTSAPGAPGAIASPSHDPVSTAVSDATIDVAWGAASDGLSGIAGYSFHFSADADEDCDADADSDEDEHTALSPPLADGSWYFHVCAVDLAGNVGPTTNGGPWIVDTTPPSGLAVSSSSHTVSTWSNDNSVDFSFSGATDANGVAGYAVVYDQTSGTVPACTTTQVASTFTGSSSPDSDHWWIHVRARDEAGNCGAALHLGPFWIDTVAPGTVSGLTSTDHAVGLPSIDPTIAMNWSAATDDRSGVAGYSVQFGGSASSTCYGSQETSGTSFTSAALAHGDWYVQVCARDDAGNWGAVVQAGPYTIDLVAPQALLVEALVALPNIEVAEGEVIGGAVEQMKVYFSESMSTSAGLPSSYRLLRDNGDGFQTTSCAGGVSPQDSLVVIDAVSLSTYRATLDVNGGVALPSGAYRLLACASLTDVAGNHLDGNGDTVANDDFARNFTVDSTPPTVVVVETDAATVGAGLDENEATNVAVTQLIVSFSEPVYDPIGDTNPDDVTNPGNYRLVESGGDGFQTVSCQVGVDPADLELLVDAVSYDGLSHTATLSVNGGVALAEGLYRLYVCGTAAIVDLFGYPLDGDVDGLGGDDFVRNFQVDTTAPSNPALTPNRPPGVWTNDNALVVAWSGATDDPSGAGLAGYSVLFDVASGTDPGTSIDVLEAAPHQAAATLADGATHFFHLVTCDRAGNCAAPIEAGPFQVDTQAPSSPAPVASSSHGDGLPHANAAIATRWSASVDQPGLSGVSGYLVSLQTAAAPPVCGGTSTGSTSATLAAPVDETYFVHVCAVDLAGNTGSVAVGGPYVVDTAGPTGLVVSSPSHALSTWSNDNSVDFSWSGATDGSGIAGYAVVYDRTSGTEPTCATTQTASTFTGSSSPDAEDWWIHVRAIDSAGNCGATVHLGPFQVDTQDPAAPTGLASSSHGVGVASNDDTIDVEWAVALDQAGLSGIDGYGFFFSTGEDDDCDDVQDVEEDVLTATSDSLPDGEHHFHICAVDNAGNWSPVASIGPFVIDTAGAAVVAIRTVADTGDGELAEGEATAVGVTQLLVEFDGAMFDASGDSDPADVTNPENYRLYQAGPDGALQTVACGTAAGDDVPVPIAAVSYSVPETMAALGLSGGLALRQESYRLLVCPTLEDDAGTAIPGFARNFIVTATDLLANPNFDHDLAGWVVTEPSPGSLLWSSSDLSSAPTSGSAEIVTASGTGAVWTLSQCFAVSATPVEASGWTEVESSVAGAPLVGARLDYFNGAGCSGAVVGSTLSPPVAGDTGGFRTYLRLTRSSPPAAALSVLVSMEVEGAAAATFTARLDDLFYGSTPALFSDGFESSDTSAWSATVP